MRLLFSASSSKTSFKQPHQSTRSAGDDPIKQIRCYFLLQDITQDRFTVTQLDSVFSFSYPWAFGQGYYVNALEHPRTFDRSSFVSLLLVGRISSLRCTTASNDTGEQEPLDDASKYSCCSFIVRLLDFNFLLVKTAEQVGSTPPELFTS